MKFEHRDGENAAGRTVSVSAHLKPEVDEDGVFEVSEDELLRRGVDPEAAKERLKDAGHGHVGELGSEEHSHDVSTETTDVSDDESGSEDSEDAEAEAEAEESGEEDESGEESEEESEEPDEKDAATKTQLMDLKKDQLVEIGESFDDVDTDQNKGPLAEDLAGRVVLEDDEGEE